MKYFYLILKNNLIYWKFIPSFPIYFILFYFTAQLKATPCNTIDSLQVISVSTGETTGHIADLYITNLADQTVQIYIPPSFIPSHLGYQSYLTLTDTLLVLDKSAEVRIQLKGYCANLFVEPVPRTINFPHFQTWIPIDITKDYKDFQPDTVKWHDDKLSRILNPIDSLPLQLSIDVDQYPEEVAWLFWYTLIRLDYSYDDLYTKNLINTPYSKHKRKEKQSIIQHGFWIITSELNGKYYSKELFESGIRKQYEPFTNLTSLEIEQIEIGISLFWTAIHQLLKESMVFDIFKINLRFAKTLDDEISQLKERGSQD